MNCLRLQAHAGAGLTGAILRDIGSAQEGGEGTLEQTDLCAPRLVRQAPAQLLQAAAPGQSPGARGPGAAAPAPTATPHEVSACFLTLCKALARTCTNASWLPKQKLKRTSCLQLPGVRDCNHLNAPIAVQVCCHGRRQDVTRRQQARVGVKMVIPGRARGQELDATRVNTGLFVERCLPLYFDALLVQQLLSGVATIINCRTEEVAHHALLNTNGPSCCIA